MLGIICVLCLPVLILDADNPPLQDVLTIFLMTFSILLPITVFMAVRAVTERNDRKFELVGFLQSIRIFRINRPFLRFIVALLFFRTGWSVFDANYILFYEQYLDVTGGFMLYILIGYISSVCFAPVIIKAASRFSKHRILALSLVANILFMLSLMYLVDVSSRFQVSAAFVFMGIGIAGTNMMPTAIIADTVDFGQLKGGGEQSGLYMAAYNLALKVCMALGVGVAFPLLQLYGFDATIQNGAEEVSALKYISCSVPIVLFIPGIMLLWNFPLTAKRLSLIQRYVRRRKPGLQFTAV